MENNGNTGNTNRRLLINLANGGDGHLDPWLERVTIRKPNQEDSVGFALHIPPTNKGGVEVVVALRTLEAAQGLQLALKTGAKPADHQLTADEVKANLAALPQPIDLGRIVEDPAELDK